MSVDSFIVAFILAIATGLFGFFGGFGVRRFFAMLAIAPLLLIVVAGSVHMMTVEAMER